MNWMIQSQTCFWASSWNTCLLFVSVRIHWVLSRIVPSFEYVPKGHTHSVAGIRCQACLQLVYLCPQDENQYLCAMHGARSLIWCCYLSAIDEALGSEKWNNLCKPLLSTLYREFELSLTSLQSHFTGEQVQHGKKQVLHGQKHELQCQVPVSNWWLCHLLTEILGKLLNGPVTQFPHLYNGNIISTYIKSCGD